jgi:long-chain acyl-CoA synthetase
MNTAAFLAKAARERPEQPAIIMGEESVSYREFHERALAIGGNLLARGCRRGDRVSFVLANSPRVLEIIYGCFAAGLVVVPVNARLHPREIGYITENSGSKVLIHGPEYQEGLVKHADAFTTLGERVCMEQADGASPFAELLDPAKALPAVLDVDPTEPNWLFYTSGTTGRPKGATWSHRVTRVMLMNHLADLASFRPGEHVIHAAPLSHGSGILAMPVIARAATNVILHTPSFDPKALLGLVERYKAEHIAFLAPTMIVKMLEEYSPGEYDISSLRAIAYGGAPMWVEHLKKAMETFGPIFAQLFGQGEAPMTITGMDAEEHRRLLESDDPRLGSAGRIRTDVEVRVVDENDEELPTGQEGEIVVRGDVVMLGYWDNPEATAETLRGGWLHTGDVGAFDEHGYLYILDRSKDMVVSGGNNVYPREVEEVIITHPAVANVVVIGIPDDYWGEAVHAVVVLEPGATATPEEIIAHCGDHLAGYKKPKGVDFVDELPVSAYGKILRREVREKYWAEQGGRRVGGSGGTVSARS